MYTESLHHKDKQLQRYSQECLSILSWTHEQNISGYDIHTSKKQTTMARRESNRVMVLRGRSARKARNAFTLWVLLPASQAPSMINFVCHRIAFCETHRYSLLHAPCP